LFHARIPVRALLIPNPGNAEIHMQFRHDLDASARYPSMVGTVPARMAQEFQDDIDSVSRIAAVSTILDVVCRTTGMRFAAVARVTEDRWVACACSTRSTSASSRAAN
jgi:hypothetical protein